ncbi:gamma-aminobutyric acid receptor subunit pi-like isoform X2 [Branchiostoma lanceolatum]|uniref:gamma-aminobutyric acid receptor subunit pi-like isoform X2 n=1 Tax=Branchiostoma lanceolatum TaxID=7740 RepID=UPI003454C093
MTSAIETLLLGYDLRVRPNVTGAPETIGVVIDLIGIDNISELDMQYTVTYDIRQSWVDERLDFRHLYDGEKITFLGIDTLRIWRPDTFIKNGEGSRFHDVTRDQQMMHVFRDGRVLYKLRLTTIASCWMKMHLFPFDTQNCTLLFETYGYTTSDVVYYWRGGSQSVRGFEKVRLADFMIENFDFLATTSTYSTGSFSGLTVFFIIRRNMGHVVAETYIPAGFIVALSWLSFWFSPDESNARVFLGIMTVVTITNIVAKVKSTLPRVSYIKAIDVYLGVCLVYVFGAVAEYAAVNHKYYTFALMQRRRKMRAMRRQGNRAGIQSFSEESSGEMGEKFSSSEDYSDEDSDDVIDLTQTGKARRRSRVREDRHRKISEYKIERRKKLSREEVTRDLSLEQDVTSISHGCGVDCCPDTEMSFGIENSSEGITQRAPHSYSVEIETLRPGLDRKRHRSSYHGYPGVDGDVSYVMAEMGRKRVRRISRDKDVSLAQQSNSSQETAFYSWPLHRRRLQRQETICHSPDWEETRSANSRVEEEASSSEEDSQRKSKDKKGRRLFLGLDKMMPLSKIKRKFVREKSVNRIDKISRISFPVTFVVFNIMYLVVLYL